MSDSVKAHARSVIMDLRFHFQKMRALADEMLVRLDGAERCLDTDPYAALDHLRQVKERMTRANEDMRRSS